MYYIVLFFRVFFSLSSGSLCNLKMGKLLTLIVITNPVVDCSWFIFFSHCISHTIWWSSICMYTSVGYINEKMNEHIIPKILSISAYYFCESWTFFLSVYFRLFLLMFLLLLCVLCVCVCLFLFIIHLIDHLMLN